MTSTSSADSAQRLALLLRDADDANEAFNPVGGVDARVARELGRHGADGDGREDIASALILG